MRAERKTDRQIERVGVQGYHQGGYGYGNEAYAFKGFKSNKFFTSDRFILCGIDERTNTMYRLNKDGSIDSKHFIKGFGLEIETEQKGLRGGQTPFANVLENIIFKEFPADLFKMQNDCTLNHGIGDGIECITQVMSKEFIRNNYPAFKVIYNHWFPMFGISCSEYGGCGMHVNISTAVFGATEATQTEAIRKLYYFINHHYLFCKSLFYRTGSTDWCNQMRSDLDYCKSLDLHHMSGSHGNCFNGSHFDAGRIEIRLVGGQKDFACFRNTMESIFFLVDRVKVLKWEQLDNLAVVFKGCNQYVFDRIKSYCYDSGTITASDVEAIRSNVEREQLL